MGPLGLRLRLGPTRACGLLCSATRRSSADVRVDNGAVLAGVWA
jgi:hypothetical protein